MTWLRRSLFILASWLAYGLLTPLYEAAAWLFSNGEWHTWRRQAVVMLAGQATATGVRSRSQSRGAPRRSQAPHNS